MTPLHKIPCSNLSCMPPSPCHLHHPYIPLLHSTFQPFQRLFCPTLSPDYAICHCFHSCNQSPVFPGYLSFPRLIMGGVAHWRSNIFCVHSGNAGKPFIRELSSLLRAFAEGPAMESITLSQSCVLLQKPHPPSTT